MRTGDIYSGARWPHSRKHRGSSQSSAEGTTAVGEASCSTRSHLAGYVNDGPQKENAMSSDQALRKTLEFQYPETGTGKLNFASEGTSASEAVILQRAVDGAVRAALDEQRERIANSLEQIASTYDNGWQDAVMLDIAAAIRSGEIGGEQSATVKGEQK